MKISIRGKELTVSEQEAEEIFSADSSAMPEDMETAMFLARLAKRECARIAFLLLAFLAASFFR